MINFTRRQYFKNHNSIRKSFSSYYAEILRRNISRCFPFTRWGSILSPPGVSSVIKKTLEGAESAAKGAPDRARQRRDGPGGPGCRRLSRYRLAPARFHRALLPAGTRADPAPCDRSPCFARAVPGAGPGPAPPARPRGPGGPATCALTAARAGDGGSGQTRATSRCPGTGLPLRALPSPVPRTARCPSPELPVRGAHLSSQAGKPPAPRSLHARWGRTDGRAALPALPKAGHGGVWGGGGEGWPGRGRDPGALRRVRSRNPQAKTHGKVGGGQSRSARGRRAGSAEGGMAGGGCPGRLAPVLLLALLWPGRAAAEVSEWASAGTGRGGGAGSRGGGGGPGAERARPLTPRCRRAALAAGQGKVIACVWNDASRMQARAGRGEAGRGEVRYISPSCRAPLPGHRRGDEDGRGGRARGTASPLASGASRPSSWGDGTGCDGGSVPPAAREAHGRTERCARGWSPRQTPPYRLEHLCHLHGKIIVQIVFQA